jgi:hypothetical protein
MTEAAAASEQALYVRDVSVAFGGVRALDGASMRVRRDVVDRLAAD